MNFSRFLIASLALISSIFLSASSCKSKILFLSKNYYLFEIADVSLAYEILDCDLSALNWVKLSSSVLSLITQLGSNSDSSAYFGAVNVE